MALLWEGVLIAKRQIVLHRSSRLLREATPQSGDVLVSRPTARADVYQLQIIPAVSHLSHRCYEDGMEAGRRLAHRLGVNGWFTADHTHFMSIARRPQAGAPLREHSHD